MANVLTKNILSCDSLGIVSPGPIWVRGIMFYPNAVDDAFTLLWWDEDTEAVNTGPITYTITTATDDTIADDALAAFPNTFADGKVIKCVQSSGVNNSIYGLIKTAGDNEKCIVHLSPFTAEASVKGVFACYNTYTAFRGHSPAAADTEYSMWFPFGGRRGFCFPNLALDSLSASATVHVYVA